MNVASFIQVIAGVAWLLFFGSLVLVVFRLSRRANVKGVISLVLVFLVVAAVLSTVSAGLVFIPPQERGVVISAIAPLGYREQALQPGLRWIIPFFETVITYPISSQTYTMSIATSEGAIQGDDSIAARTADGQEIYVDASVIYAINPDEVVRVHITWQDRYTAELVRPLARGIVRDVISQFGVEEVVSTKRNIMTGEIKDGISEKLEQNGLVLIDFILRNITFSAEYAASVEQKQIAEQQAQQAAFVVEQRTQEAEQARRVAEGQADAVVIQAQGQADALIIQAQAEAQARVIQAQAEAEALDLIAAVLRDNPDLLLYQYITNLSPNIQVMLVPNDNPYLLTLPALPSAETAINPEDFIPGTVP
jgi:regulator of protease activity HflC (stomatin/prohibitin superfamily)